MKTTLQSLPNSAQEATIEGRELTRFGGHSTLGQ